MLQPIAVLAHRLNLFSRACLLEFYGTQEKAGSGVDQYLLLLWSFWEGPFVKENKQSDSCTDRCIGNVKYRIEKRKGKHIHHFSV